MDEAEDALLETLIRAWRGIDRFEGRSEFATWLHLRLPIPQNARLALRRRANVER